MKIAVVGAGISGLTAAWVLSRRHDVALFEAASHAGGHANTVSVRDNGRWLEMDTGFLVYNEPNYPNLCRMFSVLGVESLESDMSFSVHCEASGLEYNGASVNKLFGQRRNLARPAFWNMALEILRFNRAATADRVKGIADDITVDDYLARGGYSDMFIRQYLVPLGASLWSCDADTFRAFPMRFVIDFLHNHRMLQVEGRPGWRTVAGGSRRYVDKLLDDFRGRLHLNTPVVDVRRSVRAVELRFEQGKCEAFDEVVLATHADQALRLLSQPDDHERQTLQMFPYRRNRVTLHTDTSVLPDRRKLWAAWNYRVPAAATRHASVSYNLNMLQSLPAEETYCVSLNEDTQLDRSRVLRRIDYEHPVFVPGRDAAQRCHPSLVRRNRVSCCGAYWGFGFHEDGVRSALNVCEAFDMSLLP